MAGIVVRDGNVGRVALTNTGRASVSYEPSIKELKAIAKGVEVLAKMWFALGARRVVSSHRAMAIVDNEEDVPKLIRKIIQDPKNLLLGSAHPQSGNRIGKSPADSVLDSNCRVYGFQNLFVCDASVFPSSVGVNPQISVMTVASIIASRIIRDWDNIYAELPLSKNLGNTCAVVQPMYCSNNNLSKFFVSVKSEFDTDSLVNSSKNQIDDSNWRLDPESLMIYNNLQWKGIYSRDSNIQNTLLLYFGGFWKRFNKNEKDEVVGITHPYEVPVFAKNKATQKEIEGFGKVILLEYLDFPFNQFYDVLKIVDEYTMLGKAFMGTPGREILTFSMSRKYPFEFMTEEDHEYLYSKSKRPSLEYMVGIWSGRLVSDSGWSDNVFRFKYYFDTDDKGRNCLKNDYVFGNILAGAAQVTDLEDHVEMQDATGGLFHDEIRRVNDNILIGKYYSRKSFILDWLPQGLSFLHADSARDSVYLPYILRKVGYESAFRNQLG